MSQLPIPSTRLDVHETKGCAGRVGEGCLVFACVIPETVQLVPVSDVETQEALSNEAILHEDQMNVACLSSPQRSCLLTLLLAVLNSL